MTDGPQQCALPGCDEIVEQPDDGGPRRLYCSPAHRAAARKRRHAARMDTATPQNAASSDVTQPVAQEPENQPSEQPTTELPAPLGVPRQEEPEPALVPDREWSPAAAWTVSPPTLPSPRTVRTITSKRVKKEKPARTAADRKNAGTHMRRRAIASVAIASLVAGGASYFVTENVIPNTPTTLPPQAANQPSMDADVWVGKAQVVLASLGSQLDAVTQAEATWNALPEQRRTQEPAAVQALKDRRAQLEQQRATLASQLEAFKTLPDRTNELTSAQAQLDAVERTLNESASTAASPDYQEALRQLESQRDIRRKQRDQAAQALTDLRNGVEEALGSPLPADKDDTSPIVERVKAVVEGRPDPGEKDDTGKDDDGKDDDGKQNAAGGQDSAATPPREDDDEERGDVGNNAPPDPERPNTPDILADGGRESGSDTDGGSDGSDGSDGGDNKPEGPVQSVTSALGSAFGQSDTSNRDESANRRDNSDADTDTGSDESDNGSSSLGDVVRGVSGGLLGGSNSTGGKKSQDDSKDDDSDESRGGNDDGDDHGDRNESSNWWSGGNDDDGDDNRGDDNRGDRNDSSNWWSGGNDKDDDDQDDKSSSWRSDGDDDDDGGDDDRGSWRDKDEDEDEDDDRGDLSDITDGVLGGGHDQDDDDGDDDHADEDNDRKKPSGKAEHKRNKDREGSKDRGDKDDSENDRGDKDRGDKDNDRKKPSGKAEHKRDKDKDDNKKDRDDDGGHKKNSDKDSDHGDNDGDDDGGGKSDKGDDDGGKSDKGSDKGDSDGGDSDGDSGGGDDD
jgi:hypothetical protein